MKNVMIRFNLVCMVLLITVLYSCNIGEAIRFKKQLTNTDIETANFSNGDKEVHYIDMIHIGQQGFYDNVKRDIETYKQNGYVLFYEWIDFESCDDLTLRKVKKIAGFIPSQKGYEEFVAELDVEGVVVQDNSWFLGILNKLDFNVDITPSELIKTYENRFGAIVLSEKELEAPIWGKNEFGKAADNIDAIILDYRNQYLAQAIQQSEHSKIVVVYGAAHREGLLAELQILDKKWKVCTE